MSDFITTELTRIPAELVMRSAPLHVTQFRIGGHAYDEITGVTTCEM
jgi:hypothetical protein